MQCLQTHKTWYGYTNTPAAAAAVVVLSFWSLNQQDKSDCELLLVFLSGRLSLSPHLLLEDRVRPCSRRRDRRRKKKNLPSAAASPCGVQPARGALLPSGLDNHHTPVVFFFLMVFFFVELVPPERDYGRRVRRGEIARSRSRLLLLVST